MTNIKNNGDKIGLNKDNNTILYLTSSITSIGGFLMGYDIGSISCIKVLENFIDYFDINKNSTSIFNGVVVSILILGCLVGSLISGLLCDSLGRKKSIVIGAFVCLIGAIFQTFSFNVTMLFIGRFISGLGIGELSMAVPLYLSEISPIRLRGRMITMQQISIVAGILSSIVIVYILHTLDYDKNWRLSIGLQIIPTLILGCSMIFLPDSPKWLLLKHRYSDADTSLKKFGIKGNIYEDLNKGEECFLNENNERNKESAFKSYIRLFKDIRKTTLIGLSVQMFQQLAGINIVLYHSPILFSKLNNSTNVLILIQMAISSIKIIFTLPALLFIDKWKRKNCLVIGAVVMSLAMLSVAVLLRFYGPDFDLVKTEKNRLLIYFIIASILLYIVGYSFSWGPIPWIYPSELFPLEFRSKAMSLTTATNWTFNFGITLLSPILIVNYSWCVYLTLCLLCIVIAVFVAKIYPETKNIEPLTESPHVNQ